MCYLACLPPLFGTRSLTQGLACWASILPTNPLSSLWTAVESLSPSSPVMLHSQAGWLAGRRRPRPGAATQFVLSVCCCHMLLHCRRTLKWPPHKCLFFLSVAAMKPLCQCVEGTVLEGGSRHWRPCHPQARRDSPASFICTKGLPPVALGRAANAPYKGLSTTTSFLPFDCGKIALSPRSSLPRSSWELSRDVWKRLVCHCDSSRGQKYLYAKLYLC